MRESEFDEVVAEFLGMRRGQFCDTSPDLMLLRIREGLSAIGVIATVEEIAASMARNGISISSEANSGNGRHWLEWAAPSQSVNLNLAVGEKA